MLVRASRTAITIAAIALFAQGCGVNKFEICPDCEDNTADAGPIIDGGATVDGDPSIDASVPVDACVSFSPETCDGQDNDCDGIVDEGVLPGIGATCSSNVGECTEGVTECTGGEITCTGQLPNIEVCDNMDNDCNGMVDDGNPEGNVPCGQAQGECVVGLTECQAGGNLNCVGNVDPVPETCDSLDNDCDNNFDEMVPPGGDCGPTEGNTGECQLGTLTCLGGTMQCVGAVYPLPEQCDGTPDTVDHDCNGDTLLPDFNLTNNRQHCGACGNECLDNFTVMDPHINQVTCTASVCTIPAIGGCEPGFHDINGTYEDGCEYACTVQSTQEICNQVDDDCDGQVDEFLMPPNICSANGECANPSQLTPTCTASGWVCDYAGQRPNVEVDGMGNIVPETLCDGMDNDCDTATDEGDPLVGQGCAEGGTPPPVGICQGTGVYQCVAADASAPPECNITNPGQPMGTESCNNLDDDCDGTVDEDPVSGELTQWVDIGTVDIFSHEASRPASGPGDNGSGQTNFSGKACSEPGRQPWTNVRYEDAQAACVALGGGARLCTEEEWEQACVGPSTSPVQQQVGGFELVVIEAENFDVNNNGTDPDVFAFGNTLAGFSGTGYMATADLGGAHNDRTQALTQSPRLDYQVNFHTAGTYVVWMHGRAADGDSDRAHVGINQFIPTTSDLIGSFNTGSWEWEDDDGSNTMTIVVPSAGVHTINIYRREDGLAIDKLILTPQGSGFTPLGLGPPTGCNWSYDSNCTTYAPNTCNGNDFDTDGVTPGDQDDVLDTGAMAMCFTDWSGGNQIHDMSGNVKEWTEARQLNVNPIRGGSSNNTENGISCGFDFTAADNAFFFPNVGFRCCRPSP